MELFVAGCHGGETPRHRTSAFVLDGRLALDAGALTSGLTLQEQCQLEAVLVSHAHLDHVRDLATIADNRIQMGAAPLDVYGPAATLRALAKHFFNGHIWPDFTVLPSRERPTIRLLPLRMGRATPIGAYEVTAVPVHHTIDCSGFVVSSGDTAIAYSGDTGPTERFWSLLRRTKNLRMALVEVSFPDELAELATVTGHFTPKTLAEDLRKLPRPGELDVLLYHMKPVFQDVIERECARLPGLSLEVARLGDRFRL